MSSANEHSPRPARVPERTLIGIPPATIQFRAILTETSNEFLAPRLPLTGYVSIVEFDVDGGVQPHAVLFMPDPEPGKNTSFVRCLDARVEFTSR